MITKTLNAEEYKSEKRDSQDTNTSMIDISSILSLTNNKEIAWDVVESQKYAFQWFIKYMDDKRKKQIPIPEKIVWLGADLANWKVNGLNIGERLYNYVRNKYEKRDVFFDTIGYNPTIGTIIFKPQIIWTDKQTQKKYFQEFYEYISIHNKEERTTLDLMKRKKDNIAIGQKLYDNVIRKIYNRDWDLFFADHNYKNININFKRPKGSIDRENKSNQKEYFRKFYTHLESLGKTNRTVADLIHRSIPDKKNIGYNMYTGVVKNYYKCNWNAYLQAMGITKNHIQFKENIANRPMNVQRLSSSIQGFKKFIIHHKLKYRSPGILESYNKAFCNYLTTTFRKDINGRSKPDRGYILTCVFKDDFFISRFTHRDYQNSGDYKNIGTNKIYKGDDLSGYNYGDGIADKNAETPEELYILSEEQEIQKKMFNMVVGSLSVHELNLLQKFAKGEIIGEDVAEIITKLQSLLGII